MEKRWLVRVLYLRINEFVVAKMSKVHVPARPRNLTGETHPAQPGLVVWIGPDRGFSLTHLQPISNIIRFHRVGGMAWEDRAGRNGVVLA
jgi:hypothetical protein